MIENIGITYSVSHYEEYSKTGDKNLFEEIIDKMMMEGINPILQEKIRNLPLREKRMAILAFLDKDRSLFMRIKSFISSEKLTKVEHLKEVILMLREYVKVAPVEKKKFGEVMTDLNLVKHILSRIPREAFSNPNNKFLDPANGTGVFPLVVLYRLMQGLKEVIPNEEERYKHIVENQLFVSEIQPKNMFLYMCLVDPYDEYKLNIYTGNSLESGFDKHRRDVWCVDNFNYVIGNPPFNQMIDMTFVQNFYHISDSILFVHPSTWLIDEKCKQKKFNDTKNLIKDHLDSIELFNGNGIFGISLFVPCVITYINKSKSDITIKCFDRINNININYNDIFEINKFSDRDIYPKLKEKILEASKNDNLLLHLNKKNGDFYVNIPQIRGDVKNRDKIGLGMDEAMIADSFTTIISSKFEVEKSSKQQPFSFKSKMEADNFLNYIKTNFIRFCMSIYKNNQNQHRGELSILPWLDFSREWTDDDLINEFNLTNDEVKFINKNIPKYYDK